jgi:pyocin large subunit-like protein
MSHEATTWAFKQTGLKPSTKIVLLGLANCHNPHQGCFPSKKRLAEDCEMSERSVADHLKKLEEKGLIVVQESGGKRRGQFTSNRYILGFESDFCRGKELPSAKSAVGRIERSPSAKSAVGRRQNLPSNLVREPCKEP